MRARTTVLSSSQGKKQYSHFGNGLSGLDPREDLIHNTQCGRFGRNEAVKKVRYAQKDTDILTIQSGS
jgi:hypothetical protein